MKITFLKLKTMQNILSLVLWIDKCLPYSGAFLLGIFCIPLTTQLLNFRKQLQSPQSANPTIYAAKVISCHDGDTCHIKPSSGLTKKVRLLGVDAPELGVQNFGDCSRLFLNQWISGQQVEVHQFGNDYYGRAIAILYLNDLHVNSKILEHGMAFAYLHHSTPKRARSWILIAEQNAKKNKQGIWSLATHEIPEEPHVFRLRQRSLKIVKSRNVASHDRFAPCRFRVRNGF